MHLQEFSRASGLADAYFNATIPIATQPAWPLAAYAKYSHQSGLDGQPSVRMHAHASTQLEVGMLT
jgi:hypothetical protein